MVTKKVDGLHDGLAMALLSLLVEIRRRDGGGNLLAEHLPAMRDARRAVEVYERMKRAVDAMRATVARLP